MEYYLDSATLHDSISVLLQDLNNRINMAAGKPTVTSTASTNAHQPGGRCRKSYHSTQGESSLVKSEMVTLGDAEWGLYDNMTQSQADYTCKLSFPVFILGVSS